MARLRLTIIAAAAFIALAASVDLVGAATAGGCSGTRGWPRWARRWPRWRPGGFRASVGPVGASTAFGSGVQRWHPDGAEGHGQAESRDQVSHRQI